jgi:hypothetical protein
MTPAGFPHSDIHGSTLESSSPWLFAGFHVLLRLLVPRHPPCALCSLTSSSALSGRDFFGPVNHRQLGRVRGSFRHHEPYLLSLLETHPDQLRCWPIETQCLECPLDTPIDGNCATRFGCQFTLLRDWRPSGGLVRLFGCQAACHSAREPGHEVPGASAPEDWGVGDHECCTEPAGST